MPRLTCRCLTPSVVCDVKGPSKREGRHQGQGPRAGEIDGEQEVLGRAAMPLQADSGGALHCQRQRQGWHVSGSQARGACTAEAICGLCSQMNVRPRLTRMPTLGAAGQAGPQHGHQPPFQNQTQGPQGRRGDVLHRQVSADACCCLGAFARMTAWPCLCRSSTWLLTCHAARCLQIAG